MNETTAIRKVELKVSVDVEEAKDKLCELNELLKSANSLANELAETLSKLKVNIEV